MRQQLLKSIFLAMLLLTAACGTVQIKNQQSTMQNQDDEMAGSDGYNSNEIEQDNDFMSNKRMPESEPVPMAAPSRSMSLNAGVAKMDSYDEQLPSSDVNNETVIPSQDNPMIIYRGYLRLRVRRLRETMDKISALAAKLKGYVESMTNSVIVIRVPGSDFEQVMDSLSKNGKLLSKTISSNEVTAQYADLLYRKEVAEASRARLVTLLKQEQRSRERLRILQEIKRLTEQIESISSTLKTVKNLVDYFTITVELEAVLSTDQSTTHSSPFLWINNLKPFTETLTGSPKQFSIKLPSDFVLFDKEDNYLAQSADTTIIRGGIVKNDPVGDAAFWSDAVAFEMEGRGEQSIQKEQIKTVSGLKISIATYKNDDIAPRWYTVAVAVKDDNIFILEIFYPNKNAYENHSTKLLKAFKTLKVKK